MTDFDWTAFWLTLKLALITTVLLFLICLPLSWFMARRHFPFKAIIEAVIALPLVLPPSVLGFYLLVALSPSGFIGSFIENLGGPRLVFSFPGLVVGSVIYSLPFVFQPLQNAFREIRQDHLDAARTLGASAFNAFLTIALPNAKHGILTAVVLGFAHTVGEFGVVLMIGGNIPGETQVLSVSIYESVEMLDYGKANTMSAILLVLSFAMLATVFTINRRHRILTR